ncbi:sterol desaturase family protein [Mesorhizobium sp. B2-1-8]|uniref:sterol desaturase family protein n=1 Tax=Mesorhizobium sp. B2-1-8 TaxID=2589967 RepID=UPI0011293304|nr:sterol desaturase family protein [Mesorhizobium sp. B2-1-8]UCI17569.1 sterol desaturase family protein [Mesorhizobium sp. B2-1-8]
MDMFGLKSLLICALIFIPLERLFSLRPQQIFRKGIVNDLIYATFNGGIVNLLAGLMLAPAINAGALLIPMSLTNAISGQPTWLQVIEIIILTDLGVYFIHRAFHAIPALWRFHSIHHAVDEMDWLVGFHLHPVDLFVSKSLTLIPVFLLGFTTEALGIYFVIYLGHTLLIHSNVKMNFGPFKWLIVSPQLHHWHHANERAAYDKNFAGQLAIIDAIFGTFNLPGDEAPQKYGVDDPIPKNYFGQVGYPLVPRQNLPKRPAPGGG